MENNEKPVTIRRDEEGNPIGVRIRTLDEDFTVALRDAVDKDLTAEEARSYGQLPNKKQANIICAYIDEIQATLREAGGEELNGWYATCADFISYFTWYYYSDIGCVNYGTRYLTNFRARPILA